jgi:hypothetical protein
LPRAYRPGRSLQSATRNAAWRTSLASRRDLNFMGSRSGLEVRPGHDEIALDHAHGEVIASVPCPNPLRLHDGPPAVLSLEAIMERQQPASAMQSLPQRGWARMIRLPGLSIARHDDQLEVSIEFHLILLSVFAFHVVNCIRLPSQFFRPCSRSLLWSP